MTSTLAGSPRATRRTPRFTSDVSRGYLSVGLTMIPAFVAPVILVAAGHSDQSLILVCTLFIAWIFAAILLAVLPVIVLGRASGRELATWLAATTPSKGARFWWSINGGGAVSWAITGSFIAVASVIGVSRDAGLRSEPIVVILAVLVVIGSLMVIISGFAVRYARENATVGGAEFAKTRHPKFFDYLYLAVQVGTTFSTADVTITKTPMRNIVSLNSLIAFGFNTVIVALLVSVLVHNAG